MTTRRVALLPALIVPILTACTLLPRSAPLALARTPTNLPASATQTLRIAFGEHAATLQCAFASDAGGWRTACISAAGQRVLTLTANAQGELEFEAGVGVPKQIDPRGIAGDLQLALWPLPTLQAAQTDPRWTLSEPVAGTRRLHHDGHLVAEVHYADADPWRGRAWISNFRHGYSLQLDTSSDAR